MMRLKGNMKVKIFESDAHQTLEKDINEFIYGLLKLSSVTHEIIDIKYGTNGFPASQYTGTDMFATYSAMIIYK